MRPPQHARFLALLATVAVVGVGIAEAARPPQPPGTTRIAEGHLPTTCKEGDPPSGVYYSSRARTWLSAPYCVGRWGNLYMSSSQVVKAGGKVTMVAFPTEGSNSAQYAPETKSITWRFPGKRVSGCGNADLSCTVIPFKRAGKEWQWGEFHVTMPRTFFVNSPGSNCAGQRLCAGFATNAWAWAGVPPRGLVALSGSVTKGCAACGTLTGIAGATVKANGADDEKAVTGEDGRYSMAVDKGKYTVTASAPGVQLKPKSRKVNVKGATRGVDFGACEAGAPTRSAFRQAPTRKTFNYKGGCPEQTFEFWYFPNSKPDARIKLVGWNGATDEGCAEKLMPIGDVFADVKGGSFKLFLNYTRPGSGINQTGAIEGKILGPRDKATGVSVDAAFMRSVYPSGEACISQLREPTPVPEPPAPSPAPPG